MSKPQVLIAYASRFGSSSEIAQGISDTLVDDFQVDLLDLKSKSETESPLSDYVGIIVGSGIKMGRWTKEARKFLEGNKGILNQTLLGVFVSSGEASNPKTYEQAKQQYIVDILEKNQLMNSNVLYEAFGGVFDFSETSNYSFLERKILQKIADSSSSGFVVKDGKLNDFRNWQLIREWATSFGDKLKQIN
jgi:menaquinone-dependent protoporphyrinogen oxidase